MPKPNHQELTQFLNILDHVCYSDCQSVGSLRVLLHDRMAAMVAAADRWWKEIVDIVQKNTQQFSVERVQSDVEALYCAHPQCRPTAAEEEAFCQRERNGLHLSDGVVVLAREGGKCFCVADKDPESAQK